MIRKSSNHWKFLLVLFPIIGTCAYAFAPGGQAFFQAWYGSVFSPNKMPGLFLWVDAQESDSIAVQSGTNLVSTWYDLSGYNNNISQSTLANRPKYISNLINNFPALSFDGNDLLAGLFNSSVWSNKQYALVAGVFQDLSPLGVPDFHNIATSMRDANLITRLGLFSRYNNQNVFAGAHRLTTEALKPVTNSISSTNITIGIYYVDLVGGYQLLYINGSLAASNSVTTGSFASVVSVATSVGGYPAAANDVYGDFGLVGNIGEVLMANEKQTAGNLLSLHEYLKSKWGL